MTPCFIVPTTNIENIAADHSNIHLLLAHKVIASPEYTMKYRRLSEKGHYIIMDNSAFELGHSMDIRSVVAAAKEVKANEIVLPEVYEERFMTVDTVRNAIDFLNTEGYDFVKGAVIQSDTLHGYVDCVEDFLKIGIDVIHIPLIDPADGFYKHVRSKTQRIMLNRIQLVEMLAQHFTDTEVHLLGLTNPFELEVQRKHKFIRSCDSSSAFIHGYFGFNINEIGLPTEKISVKMNFEEWGIEPGTHKWWRVQRNIQQIKAFCYDD